MFQTLNHSWPKWQKWDKNKSILTQVVFDPLMEECRLQSLMHPRVKGHQTEVLFRVAAKWHQRPPQQRASGLGKQTLNQIGVRTKREECNSKIICIWKTEAKNKETAACVSGENLKFVLLRLTHMRQGWKCFHGNYDIRSGNPTVFVMQHINYRRFFPRQGSLIQHWHGLL